MAYDPQRDRRRPRPAADDAVPIDALLDVVEPGGDEATSSDAGAESEAGGRSPASGPEPWNRRADPPPPVSVTPGPADPWSDRQLLRAVVASVVLTLVGAVAVRWLWRRLRAGRR